MARVRIRKLETAFCENIVLADAILRSLTPLINIIMIVIHTSWLLLGILTWASDLHSFEYFAVNINFAVAWKNTGMEARYLTAKC